MRAFVTGGTGFVGSHLVDALTARGDEVTLLVRSLDKLAVRFRDRPSHAIRGDLFDNDALREGIERADVVYHLAGATAARSRSEFFRINEEGTRRVIEAARTAAPALQRFVYVSSLAAAGPSRRGEPRDETMPPGPVSQYGESKLAGETLVTHSGLPWTVVRPSSVFGPWDAEFRRVFVLAKRGFVPIPGSPQQELSFIYVADLVSALLDVLAPAALDRVYFVAHPDTLTAASFAGAVHQAVGNAVGAARRLRIVPIPAWLTRSTLTVVGGIAQLAGRATLLSADKASELLSEAWTCTADALVRDVDWAPRHDHAEALLVTARWYQEHGWL